MDEPQRDGWQVICLCAQWCSACRDWRDAFESAAARHPELHFAWIDIEDEADTVGEVDIETFPTMLIAQGTQVRFFGPVLPSVDQLSRLLNSLRAQPGAATPEDEAGALLRRLVFAGLLHP